MNLNRGAADDPILQGIFELLTRMVQRAVADSKGEGMAKTDGLDPILLQKEAQSFLAWLRREDGEIDEIFSSVQSEMFDVAATASPGWRSGSRDDGSIGREASRSGGRENGSDRAARAASERQGEKEMSYETYGQKKAREHARELAASQAARQAELDAHQARIEQVAPEALAQVDNLVFGGKPTLASNMAQSMAQTLDAGLGALVEQSREAAKPKERQQTKQRKPTAAESLAALMQKRAGIDTTVKTKDLSGLPVTFEQLDAQKKASRLADEVEAVVQDFDYLIANVLAEPSIAPNAKPAAITALAGEAQARLTHVKGKRGVHPASFMTDRRRLESGLREVMIKRGLAW